MNFFTLNPKRRLFFLGVYGLYIIFTLFNFIIIKPLILKILFLLLMVFAIYVTLTKANIIFFKYKYAADDFKFDVTGLVLSVILLITIYQFF